MGFLQGITNQLTGGPEAARRLQEQAQTNRSAVVVEEGHGNDSIQQNPENSQPQDVYTPSSGLFSGGLLGPFMRSVRVKAGQSQEKSLNLQVVQGHNSDVTQSEVQGGHGSDRIQRTFEGGGGSDRIQSSPSDPQDAFTLSYGTNGMDSMAPNYAANNFMSQMNELNEMRRASHSWSRP